MKTLGASYNDEEYASFMAVWRYSGHLMGIPETILFHDADDALKLYEIGLMCEPDSPNRIGSDGPFPGQLSTFDCRDDRASRPPPLS